jgi:hypothetical protein
MPLSVYEPRLGRDFIRLLCWVQAYPCTIWACVLRESKTVEYAFAVRRFACRESVELGYEGRVGLHSLPRPEGFYEKQNMFNCGPEEEYDNLVYFEYGALRRR